MGLPVLTWKLEIGSFAGRRIKYYGNFQNTEVNFSTVESESCRHWREMKHLRHETCQVGWFSSGNFHVLFRYSEVFPRLTQFYISLTLNQMVVYTYGRRRSWNRNLRIWALNFYNLHSICLNLLSIEKGGFWISAIGFHDLDQFENRYSPHLW